MAGGASFDDDEGIVSINVTPLVDIMLVLLIIFMVATSYIVQNSIEVDLPKAASGGETLDTTLSVILQKDGSYYLNGEKTTLEGIAAKCREVYKTDGDKSLAIISADKEVSHGKVVKLIDTVRINGVKKFAINIEPETVEEQ